MSVSAFLQRGRVEDFLNAQVNFRSKRRNIDRQIGRPVVYTKALDADDSQPDDYRGTVGIFIVCKENAPVRDYNQAESMIRKFESMLAYPEQQIIIGDENSSTRQSSRLKKKKLPENVYVLWEVWMDRENQEDGFFDESLGYSKAEAERILNGPEQRNKCGVVRYIRKVGRQTKRNYNCRFFETFDDYNRPGPAKKSYPPEDEDGYFPNITEYPIVADGIWKEDLNTLLGNTVDIVSIGTSCGPLFRFPVWMDEGEGTALDKFIKTYNKAAMKIILTRNDVLHPANGRRPLTAAYRKQQYKELRTAWFEAWLNCIKGPRSIHGWLNTFSLAQLQNHFFSSMSMFTWFGDEIFEEMDTDEAHEYNVAAENIDSGFEIEVNGKRDGFLLPTDRRTIISWQKLEKLLPNKPGYKPRFEIPERTFVTEIHHAKHPNIYALLILASGAQGLEFSNLASFLGTGSHIKASLTALESKKRARLVIESAITDPARLQIYENELPKIVDDVGKELATTPLVQGESNVCDAMVAVEFPVYLLDQRFTVNRCFLYSRIDAISKGIGKREEYAIWEFKTRWADNSEYDKKANVDDIRQAAFYCYCFSQMTGISVDCFYIRYIKIDPVVENSLLHVYTHKYRYKNATGSFIIDFATWLNEIPAGAVEI